MSMNDGSNKRRAHIGQWRTPPQPFFPNTSTGNSRNAQVPNANNPTNDGGNTSTPRFEISLPPGMEATDYAAFQEAYRRGAEAAAALAQPNHPNHAAAQRALFAAGYAAAQQHNRGHPQQQNQQQQQSTDQTLNFSSEQGSTATSRPPSSLMAATAASLQPTNSNQPQNQAQPVQQPTLIQSNSTITHHPCEHVPIPNPTPVTSSNMPSTSNPTPPPNMNFNMSDADLTPNPVVVVNAGPGVAAPGGISSAASRSISLPDMARYAARATAEDQKRKKRLARNRASARLRRLKKKNLVDTYEGEVGVLEAALAKLQAHSWGTDHDHEALLEALSMDRGQQPLPPEKRQALIHDILKQQREQVQNIRDVHFEVMLLGWLVDEKEGGVVEPQDKAEREEEEALARELNDILSLTPEQKSELKKATQTSHEELKAIETVDMCLEAMLNNSWIMNHPVEEITQQFMSILNSGQMSKFLLWTDHNSEAIDQLDYVNAPPASAPPVPSPTFVFGTDNEADFHD